MKSCKNCGKEMLITTYGLNAFCSHLCKKNYRQQNQANWLKNKRNPECRQKEQCKPSCSQNVDSEEVHEKPNHEASKQGLGLSMDNFSGFGGKKWYDMAKRYCCNFEVREREGNCLTLYQPYSLFTKPCNQCDLGMALNLRYQ